MPSMWNSPRWQISKPCRVFDRLCWIGIFSGKEVKWATLKFTPERARWTASERWHSKQIGKYLDDGSYELKVPYSKAPELIIDIMKYGPDVEVVEPQELRKAVQENLIKTLRNYGK